MKSDQSEVFLYYGAFIAVVNLMPPEERAAFDEWDGNRPGDIASSDWPGFAKYSHIMRRPSWWDEPPPPRIRKQPVPVALRWSVWMRDNFTCRGCGSRDRLTVDHVIPESKGGLTEIDNLQTLCHSCNARKGARIE